MHTSNIVGAPCPRLTEAPCPLWGLMGGNKEQKGCSMPDRQEPWPRPKLNARLVPQSAVVQQFRVRKLRQVTCLQLTETYKFNQSQFSYELYPSQRSQADQCKVCLTESINFKLTQGRYAFPSASISSFPIACPM
ncbi:hypothetical protein NDU88_006200 [Pleurodeles waltl]|uniref:Uncharacterized protein n=1 Tax=Pleurodeles waltl TaxID=8319 RepID=A0AAV7UKB8_PLEWA|nr:hypothetical protein NDU88_006200 [Pleurodeles waltl]